jgi:membrane protein DedA with SNARE-associated domain
MARARAGLHRRAAMSVFLSRWALAALGPWVNLVAGATGIGWRRFSAAALAGRIVWVGGYTGLGHILAERADEIGPRLVAAIGILGGGLVAVLAGRWLWQNRRARGD